jgi:O-antigen/teichoic acid export membrane protein
MSAPEAAFDDTPRRILNTLSAGIGSVVFVSILGAYSVRLMTTHLGASAFGIFVLVQAFVSLAWNFSDLGLSEVLQRDIARDDQDERWLLSHAMGLRVSLGIIVVPVAAVIGFLVYAHRPDMLKVGLVILLCSVPFAMAQEVAAAHFTARLRNRALAIGSAVQQLIFVGLVLLAVSLHRSIVFCIGAALAGSVISSIYILVAARREVSFSPAFSRSTWLSMLRTSSPVGLAYIVGSLYVKADTIILSFLSNVKQIGYYGVSYSILSVFLVLPIIITRTFIPSLVKASGDAIEPTADASLAFFAIGGTFSATGVMVCGPTVVRIIAGTHFGPSIIPLRVLGFGLIFIFMSNGLSSICLARGATSKLFQVNALSLLFNIGLNIAAIPSFGIDGAAEATLLCEAISMLFMMYLVSTQANVRPKVFHSLTRPFAAGVITCALLAPIYLHHDLGVGIGLALVPAVAIIYFGTLAALRGIPDEIYSGIRSLRRART